MENYIKNVCDITYKSELTPTPIFISVWGWFKRVKFESSLKLKIGDISKLVWGLNSTSKLTSFHSVSLGLI